MSVVNLNKARKARAKIEARQTADENAIKFGRNKSERIAIAAQSEKMRAKLDQLKFEDEE